jgi:hypothetical protein
MAAKRRLPFMQFYPADWRSDIGVRALTPGARGFWVDCMCLMHEAEQYGHLLISGKVPTDGELAPLVTMTKSAVRKYRQQVIDRQVASVTADGVLYSRSMVRDEERRRRNRDNGSLGGNPRLSDSDNRDVIHLDNPPDKAVDNPSDKARGREAQRLRGSEAREYSHSWPGYQQRRRSGQRITLPCWCLLPTLPP